MSLILPSEISYKKKEESQEKEFWFKENEEKLDGVVIWVFRVNTIFVILYIIY